MGVVKVIHVTCVVLSFSGFFIRGIWMLWGSGMLRRRWVRIVPQIIDTLLLLSAITLAFQLRFSHLEQPWLLAKIIALFVYIGVGLIALRFGQNKSTRLLAWLLGLLIFIYMVSVAFSKSALGFFVFF